MTPVRVQSLAIPAVLLLIAFLSLSSQHLFRHIDPGPLSFPQTVRFNLLVAALLVSYVRSCLVGPGFVEPSAQGRDEKQSATQRWCRKCQAPKPPRAHHCKVCQRCVMRMDHHCPWTVNCVGHRTFPHFVRFLLYAVVAMAYLGYFLFARAAALWGQRQLSSHLGPSSFDLAHLLALCLVNTVTCFALFVILCRTLYCLGANITAVESWEIERHAALLRRARKNGGFVHGPGGVRIRLVRHEFPYDIGIYQNIAQGMGSYFPWMWLWPFASTPSATSGMEFETNDFNDPGLSWPPPDPEKMPQNFRRPDRSGAFVHNDDKRGEDEWIAAFNKRQREDLARRQGVDGSIRQRQPHKPATLGDDGGEDSTDEDSEPDEADEGWRNAEGERLADYGVDEAADADEGEEHIPLSQLIARRDRATR